MHIEIVKYDSQWALCINLCE